VHRAAEEGMWMADDRYEFRIGIWIGPEQGFETACWSFEKKTTMEDFRHKFERENLPAIISDADARAPNFFGHQDFAVFGPKPVTPFVHSMATDVNTALAPFFGSAMGAGPGGSCMDSMRTTRPASSPALDHSFHESLASTLSPTA
jgi:hypothetical protein